MPPSKFNFHHLSTFMNVNGTTTNAKWKRFEKLKMKIYSIFQFNHHSSAYHIYWHVSTNFLLIFWMEKGYVSNLLWMEKYFPWNMTSSLNNNEHIMSIIREATQKNNNLYSIDTKKRQSPFHCLFYLNFHLPHPSTYSHIYLSIYIK